MLPDPDHDITVVSHDRHSSDDLILAADKRQAGRDTFEKVIADEGDMVGSPESETVADKVRMLNIDNNTVSTDS